MIEVLKEGLKDDKRLIRFAKVENRKNVHYLGIVPSNTKGLAGLEADELIKDLDEKKLKRQVDALARKYKKA